MPEGAIVLAGPRYALLRPEFGALRATLGERDGVVRRMLVFLSGADEHDVTGRAAAAAVAAGFPVDVVVGSAYPRLRSLEAWAAGRDGVTLHVETPDMASLMARADLAVGAPSSAAWERCTLRLPSILVTLADNQVEVAGLLHDAGAALTLGWHAEVTTQAIVAAITSLAADPARLREMGRIAGDVTDGAGTRRVVDALAATLADHQGRQSAGEPAS